LPLDRLLTSKEVAEILRIPTRTLDHFAYERTGPQFFKIGKYRRYHPRDVQEWLASQRAD
jgi:DNA-binding transcriptional MerR regulator